MILWTSSSVSVAVDNSLERGSGRPAQVFLVGVRFSTVEGYLVEHDR